MSVNPAGGAGFDRWQIFLATRRPEDFDRAYSALYPSVKAISRSFLKDDHLAEDVCQAVFIVLYRKQPNLTEEKALWSWIWKTTRFMALKSKPKREESLSEEAEEMTVPDSEDGSDRSILVGEELKRLKEDDRQVILLRYLGGQSIEEVARTLQVSVSAAQMRVSRSIERLRKGLSQRGVQVSAAALGKMLEPVVATAPVRSPSVEAARLATRWIAQGTTWTVLTGALATAAASATAFAVFQYLPRSMPKPSDETPFPVSAAVGKEFLKTFEGSYVGTVEWANEEEKPGSSKLVCEVRPNSDQTSVRILTRYDVDGTSERDILTFDSSRRRVMYNQDLLSVTWGKDNVQFEGLLKPPSPEGRPLPTRVFISKSGDSLLFRRENGAPYRLQSTYRLKLRAP